VAIQDVQVRITANDAQFMAAMNRVERRMRGMQNIARRMGGALAAIGGAAGFGALIKGAVDTADQIQKLSIRLGASTEALSEYQLVAERTGVTFQTLTTGWQRMTRRISEAARGTGEAKDALRELGLSAQALEALKPDEQFEAIADAMRGVESQSRRVALAMKIFDTEGVALLQTMEGGSKAMREMREEARRLGLSLDRDAADKAAELKDATTNLSAAMKGLSNELVTNVAPAFTTATDSITGFIVRAREGAAALATTGGLFKEFYDFVGINPFVGQIGKSLIDQVAGDAVEANKVLPQTNRHMRELVSIGREARLLADATEPVIPGATGGAASGAGAAEPELAVFGSLTNYQAAQETYDRNVQLRKQFLSEMAQEDIAGFEHMDRLRQEWLRDQEQETNEFYVQAARNVQTLLGDTIYDSITGNFDGILDRWRETVDRMASEFLASQLATTLFGESPGQGGGGFGGLIGQLMSSFGGARASGGPVSSGKSYLVGENGPEIFSPSQSGQIIPNGASFGGASIVMNISTNDADSFRRSSGQIQAEMQAALSMAARRNL